MTRNQNVKVEKEHDDGHCAAVSGRRRDGDDVACYWDGGEVALFHGRDVVTGDDRSER